MTKTNRIAAALAALLLAACGGGDGVSDAPDGGDSPDAPTAAQLDIVMGVWDLTIDIGLCLPGQTRSARLELTRDGASVTASVTPATLIASGASVAPFLAELRLEDEDQRWDLELRDGAGETSAEVAWSDLAGGGCSTVVAATIDERTR